jgi:hypothetical protein
MQPFYTARSPWLRIATALAVILVSTGTGAVPASAGGHLASLSSPSRVKIPANFVYVSQVKDDRCLWGIGVEFPTVPKATSYTIDYFDGYYNQEIESGASVPIPASDELGHGMNYLGITGGGGPAPCVADVTEGGRFVKPVLAWANFPGEAPKTGAIEGMVTDADGDPLAGAVVTADGPGHGTAVSGPGGIYYMTVDAGSYRVVPSYTTGEKSSFAPLSASVSVPEHGSTRADFKLDSGIHVTIDLSSTSVPASGFAIVKGTISTTRFGKPDPGVTVNVSVDPTDVAAALTTAPKVAVCGTTGRIWPVGPNITDLDPKSVNVVTDANGHYAFSLTVGTVPGDWTLDAWAENQDGSLSTDVPSASDTKVLTVVPVTPNTALSNFLVELNSANSVNTAFAGQLDPQNPGGFAYLLALTAKTRLKGLQFGGLNFSVGNAADGQDVVIAPATTQFRISSSGQVQRSAGSLNSLIIDPQEWTGRGLPTKVSNAASLNSVVQGGKLPDIPTVAVWESGSSGHLGWTLKPQTLSISTNVLAYWGWAYPPPAAWPSGYCQ